jgi:hypothetical protein
MGHSVRAGLGSGCVPSTGACDLLCQPAVQRWIIAVSPSASISFRAACQALVEAAAPRLRGVIQQVTSSAASAPGFIACCLHHASRGCSQGPRFHRVWFTSRFQRVQPGRRHPPLHSEFVEGLFTCCRCRQCGDREGFQPFKGATTLEFRIRRDPRPPKGFDRTQATSGECHVLLLD